MTLKLGVLVSGRGTNLEAILSAIDGGKIPGAEVAVVISNRPGVRALEVAAKHGVPSEVIEGTALTRSQHDLRVMDSLRMHDVVPGNGLVLLAGYMRLLGSDFVAAYRHRIMNVHPSLLPAFPGLEAQKQALDYGVKVAGCTVHFVVPEVDAGPIILQKAVEVRDGDTPESLSERILQEEHVLYPLAVKLFVEGKLTITGRKVTIKP